MFQGWGGVGKGSAYQLEFCEVRLKVERGHSVDRIEIWLFIRSLFFLSIGKGPTKPKFANPI